MAPAPMDDFDHLTPQRSHMAPNDKFIEPNHNIGINFVYMFNKFFEFFKLSSDSTRRSLAMGSVTGSGGRAHPSLAKLRDNLLNGTIDFADIPITEMNTDDIRAELKRVYTQLRMYKLKNIYQENPHISKRKGGGKKIIEKTASKNRRISIPPPTASNSPKAQRLAEEPIMSGSNGGIVAADDEKSDLTVESAPHNLYLSTSNKVRFLDVTKESMSGSVRV